MKRWAVPLMLAMGVAMFACGGEDPPDPPTVFIPGPAPAPPSCDAITHGGCEAGEKCTLVYLDPFQEYDVSACTADGTLAIGEPCTESALGEPDQCAAGSFCFRETCTEVCTFVDDGDTCGPNTICGLFSSLYNDQAEQVGLCAPICDPVTQNCPLDDGCYMREINGLSSCTRVPAEAAMRYQDDRCLGPGPDTCYSNGCARGFGTFLLSTGTCMQFCDPVDLGIGQLDDIRGDANGVKCGDYHESAGEMNNTECRYFNGILEFEPGNIPPNSLGICMSESFMQGTGLGSCTTHDLNAAYTPENVENGSYVLGCEPYTDQVSATGRVPEELRAIKRAIGQQMGVGQVYVEPLAEQLDLPRE